MISCILCYPDIINGLIIGVISSTIVAIATYIIINQKKKSVLKQKYGKAAGEYKGYVFQLKDEAKSTIDDNNLKWILRDEPVSEAKIEYIRDNILRITLMHDKLVWQGDITMELETTGSIAWRYMNLPNEDGKEQHKFGHKTCIVRNVEQEEYAYVYLIGNKMEGYGKEVLIRKK